MKKFFISIMLIVLVISSAALAAKFSDVASNHWALPFIDALSDQKVVNGYPDGTYRPDATLTYGEYIKLIVSASMPEVDFTMVDSPFEHWAGPYLTVLENFEIVEKGVISKERLDEPVSRIEVVRILGECDIKIRKSYQKTTLLEFTDILGITDIEKTLLRHAVATGVISGDPAGTFRPNDTLIRSEVAKIIYMYTAE